CVSNQCICASGYTGNYNSTSCIAALDGPCNGQGDCDYGTVGSRFRRCICNLGYDPTGTRCEQVSCKTSEQSARLSNVTTCLGGTCFCDYTLDSKFDPGTQKCVTMHQLIGE